MKYHVECIIARGYYCEAVNFRRIIAGLRPSAESPFPGYNSLTLPRKNVAADGTTRIFFGRDRSPAGLSPFKIRLPSPDRVIVRLVSQDRIGSGEGGLAKYLITFELTYRHRDNWTFSCRGSVSTLRNVVRIYGSPGDPFIGAPGDRTRALVPWVKLI